MLLVDVSEKYEIAEKVLLIYTSSFTILKKEGQKLKAKRSLSYFMVEVKLLSPYLLVSISKLKQQKARRKYFFIGNQQNS